MLLHVTIEQLEAIKAMSQVKLVNWKGGGADVPSHFQEIKRLGEVLNKDLSTRRRSKLIELIRKGR